MTKEVGVIADIHSNFTAFKTAVEYMENRGITEYILLGDYVSDTTDTVETMAYLYNLIERYDVKLIRGNREDYFIDHRKVLRGEKEGPEWLYNSASGNLQYTYELLTDRDLDFFESLPISFKYECKGFQGIICCHGSPDNSRELMQFDGENTEKWLEKIDADYLLAAHTHYQGEREINGKHYFNTGSSGLAIDHPGLVQCLILHGSDEEEPGGASWRAEFLNLPYDVDYVINAIYEKGLMEKGKWFICNNVQTLKTGLDNTIEFVQEAIKFHEEKTGKPVNWPYIDEDCFEKAAMIWGIKDYRINKD